MLPYAHMLRESVYEDAAKEMFDSIYNPFASFKRLACARLRS